MKKDNKEDNKDNKDNKDNQVKELSNKRGTFCLNRSLIIQEPELVMKLMSKMIILRCEFMFIKDVFEYDAVCDELFDEIPERADIPFYAILVDEETKEFKAEKIRRK